jgi:hypothetical protein
MWLRMSEMENQFSLTLVALRTGGALRREALVSGLEVKDRKNR